MMMWLIDNDNEYDFDNNTFHDFDNDDDDLHIMMMLIV